MEQEMTGWQWHQLDHMQIIFTSLQPDKHTHVVMNYLSRDMKDRLTGVELDELIECGERVFSCDEVFSVVIHDTDQVMFDNSLLSPTVHINIQHRQRVTTCISHTHIKVV